jgi:hypothetical protein
MIKNYGPPASHPPEIISQDINNRFVTDEQIAFWNTGSIQVGVYSFAFVRAQIPPETPTGGSIEVPVPDGGIWIDTIPAGTDPVYMSKRLFTSDGLDPQDATWSVPVIFVKNGDTGDTGATGDPGADGNSGIPGAAGVDGVDGVNGADGVAGTPITWVGDSPVPPLGAENGDAYYNTTDKKSYVMQDSSWYQMTIDGTDGQDGTDGIAIVWKGDSSSPPADPEINWVYKDTDNGIIYIWTGSAWEVMVLDGDDGQAGAEGADGLSVYITYHDDPADGDPPATPTSVEGNDNFWHTNATSASNWMSQKIDDGTTTAWGAAIKIKGIDGESGVDGYNNATVYLYRRTSTDTPPSGPATDEVYTFSTGILTSMADWSQLLPAFTGGNPYLWAVTAVAKSQTPTDIVYVADWADPQLLASDGSNGIDGLNSATVNLYQRTPTNVAPNTPTTSETYTFATGDLTPTDEGWLEAIPTNTGSNPYLWIIQAVAVANTATDTVLATDWGAVELLSVDGEEGPPGADGEDIVPDLTVPPTPTGLSAVNGFGTITLSWDASSSSIHDHTEIWRWTSDNRGSASLVAVIQGTMFADTPPNNSLSVTYYYWIKYVSKWDVVGPFNSTSGLAASTADDPEYVLQNLIATKWAGSTAYVVDDTITPTTPDGRAMQVVSITGDGLSGTIEPNWAGLAVNGTLVDNQVTWKLMADNVALTSFLKPALVDGVWKLAIQEILIADATITSAKIANLAVDTAQIANGAIVNAKIYSLAASKITTGTITAAVSMTSASMVGAVITGGIIQTNSNIVANGGIKISSDLLQVRDSSGNLRVKLGKLS